MTPSSPPALVHLSPNASRSSRKENHQPKLGFAGVGWIGRHRLEAIHAAGLARVSAIADSSPDALSACSKIVPAAATCDTFEQLLLDGDLNGVVIATPSALHAEQSKAAFNANLAVFCQKPLGRNAREVREVIAAAREADRLLGVDLCYRQLAGVHQIRQLCRQGDLGHIFAVNLVFHNAYGPDKPWFYNRQLAGGGCVLDLGIHLVDLALWVLGETAVEGITSRLFCQGKPLHSVPDQVEDFAEARVDLSTGTTLRLACSWKLPAGCDAVIRAEFYGTRGGAILQNVNGSFYEFESHSMAGTNRTTLTAGPEEWGGRAAVEWARKLASGSGYDPEIETLIPVAEILDGIYSA